MPICKNCLYGQPESTLIDGNWYRNGRWFCYAENSTANGDKWDQLCPTGEITCTEYVDRTTDQPQKVTVPSDTQPPL